MLAGLSPTVAEGYVQRTAVIRTAALGSTRSFLKDLYPSVDLHLEGGLLPSLPRRDLGRFRDLALMGIAPPDE
jgi:hypothetical protein